MINIHNKWYNSSLQKLFLNNLFFVTFTKYLFKSSPEIIVKYCVYYGVKGAVAVPKPEEKFKQCLW